MLLPWLTSKIGQTDCSKAAADSYRMSYYMEAVLEKQITTKLNKAIDKISKSDGTRSVAMKALLAQTSFKPQILEDIGQEVRESDNFPFNNLNTHIGQLVNTHLGQALLEQAQKEIKESLLRKFNADTNRALEEVKDELKDAGLMK